MNTSIFAYLPSSGRFTISGLRALVQFCNDDLLAKGKDLAFEERGRNGYQAVDQYRPSERAAGSTGVDCNTGCGTSREVAYYVEREYWFALDNPNK